MKSSSSRRLMFILLRVILTVTLSAVALLALFLLFDQYFNGLILNLIDRFAPQLVHFVRNYKPLFFALLLILVVCACWVVSQARANRTMTRMVASAVDQVFQKDEGPVRLPVGYEDMEAKLNAIKYENTRNTQLAEQAEQRKNDLVVYLAHDLKTPLTSVIGYLSLLCETGGELPPAQREKYLAICLDKAYRLEDLISEFFEITRYNLQSITLEKTALNLPVMLAQLADEFYPALSERGITCRVDAPDEMVIAADPDKLARVFDNLLRNALAYSDPHTEIGIAVRREGGQVSIAFSNQGPAIPSHKLESIFEKFYRLDTSRSSRTGGSGLGLAIAKEIVTQHGGAISAQSDEQATVFTVVLPLPQA